MNLVREKPRIILSSSQQRMQTRQASHADENDEQMEDIDDFKAFVPTIIQSDINGALEEHYEDDDVVDLRNVSLPDHGDAIDSLLSSLNVQPQQDEDEESDDDQVTMADAAKKVAEEQVDRFYEEFLSTRIQETLRTLKRLKSQHQSALEQYLQDMVDIIWQRIEEQCAKSKSDNDFNFSYNASRMAKYMAMRYVLQNPKQFEHIHVFPLPRKPKKARRQLTEEEKLAKQADDDFIDDTEDLEYLAKLDLLREEQKQARQSTESKKRKEAPTNDDDSAQKEPPQKKSKVIDLNDLPDEDDDVVEIDAPNALLPSQPLTQVSSPILDSVPATQDPVEEQYLAQRSPKKQQNQPIETTTTIVSSQVPQEEVATLVNGDDDDVAEDTMQEAIEEVEADFYDEDVWKLLPISFPYKEIVAFIKNKAQVREFLRTIATAQKPLTPVYDILLL